MSGNLITRLTVEVVESSFDEGRILRGTCLFLDGSHYSSALRVSPDDLQHRYIEKVAEIINRTKKYRRQEGNNATVSNQQSSVP